MSNRSLFKIYHPLGILLIGLGIAQVIAFFQVYQSNSELHRTVSTLYDVGYLAVPNLVVMNRLQEFWPAFWGGLFFTLSSGAGFSLAGMAAGWLWSGLCRRNRFVLFIFLSIWGGVLLIFNIHGFTLYPSLYCGIIAPTLFLLTTKWEAHSAPQFTGRLQWLHILSIPLLGLLWFTQFDAELFIDLRDNLLLSNYPGKKINQFYYRYTLYPAEAFKSLDQKLIRTCRLEGIQNPAIKKKLTRALLTNDYLPVQGDYRPHLQLHLEDTNLVFSDGDRTVLKIGTQQFFTRPQKAFQKYSESRDLHGAFRQFTYLSLLVGFPVLIYLFLHFGFYYLTALFWDQKSSAIIASLMCLLIGILVLVYFQSHRTGRNQIKNIDEALDSKNLSVRIAALKLIHRKKMDVVDYPSYPNLIQSTDTRERYWLAVAMAGSRSPKTYGDLLELLDDKSINVRTMALQSLSLRKNRQAISPILDKIRTSRDWYDQLYAYKALRSLGWKQKQLP
jgi:hypothetical protein